MPDAAGNGTPPDDLNVLLIVYERTGDGADVREALRDYETHTQLTETAWIVRTPRSVPGVFDALDRHLEPEDRLFVGALTGEAAWRNLEQGYDWLRHAFVPGGAIE